MVLLVVLSCLFALDGCSGTSGVLSPSPIIVPDAITVTIGHGQVFEVHNATVASFSLSCDSGDWRQFVAIDSEYRAPNAIRIVGLKPTESGYLYVSATLGTGRSPLVSMVVIGQ